MNQKLLSKFVLVVGGLCMLTIAGAQSTKEVTQELSKPARKGMLDDVKMTSDGKIAVTYVMRVDKKSDKLTYENYLFDKDLKFSGIEPITLQKERNEPRKKTRLKAYAGGGNSFNVLSQKLSLQKEEWMQRWDYKRQVYEWSERLSKETVKLRNNDGRYNGYCDYLADDGLVIIASFDPDKKGVDPQFVCLFVDFNLNVKETPVTTEGNYSLVYTGSLKSGNIFVIMAPNAKMPNLTEYVYAEFSPKGELVTRSKMNAPSPNFLVMDYRQIGDDLYLVGASTKDKDCYDDKYSNFADISNPGMGASWADQKYADKVYKTDYDNFHFLKLNGGKLAFATTTPIKSFKDKLKTPPSQKKSHPYEGKKLGIENLAVAPNGDYLLVGQLMNREMVKGNLEMKYLDFIGLQIDPNGNVKSQYAIEKVNDDSKSEIFPSEQNFYFSADGKTATWEIMEVKGTKGYASFWDAYNDVVTFTGHYFPRLIKINLADGSISDPVMLGDKGKYMMYKFHGDYTDPATKTRYYFGHDDDYEKLWIGKYKLD